MQAPVRSDEALVAQAFATARDHLGVTTRLAPANFWRRVRGALPQLLACSARLLAWQTPAARQLRFQVLRCAFQMCLLLPPSRSPPGHG